MNEMNNIIKSGVVITAGNIDNFNMMTINWGLFGTMWREDVFVFFVRPSRYTNEFLHNNDYFTINFFFPAYRREISFIGSNSGRDIDKVKEIGFHPIQLENGVGFTEAEKTIVCKKLYFQDLNINNIPEDIRNVFYVENDVHQMFVGEIIRVYENS